MRPVRILTVDDSAHFRDASRALVAHTPGFESVGEAADGESALQLARRADPDMLIVDVRMDGMDGIDVACRVRDEDVGRVVVLVSSGDVRELTPLAESCGAAAVVRKHWLSPRMLRGLWVAHRRR
jgi:DNA-binding NarL/FixJ family response regulator